MGKEEVRCLAETATILQNDEQGIKELLKIFGPKKDDLDYLDGLTPNCMRCVL